MTTASLIACLAGSAAGLAVIVEDQFTPGQTWTLLGVLVFVLGAFGAGIKWAFDRGVQALDKNTVATTTVATKLGELVSELKSLAVANSVFQSKLDDDRDRAVAEIKAALERVPEDVANEITKRRQ